MAERVTPFGASENGAGGRNQKALARLHSGGSLNRSHACAAEGGGSFAAPLGHALSVDCDVGARRATFCVEMTNNPPESNWLKFGQWVAACRVAQGYSQAELARRIGKNEQTVYRIEKGSPTKRPTVLKIAEALGQDEHDAVAIAFGLPEQPPDTRATRFNYSRTLAQIHDLLASVPPDEINRLISAIATAYSYSASGENPGSVRASRDWDWHETEGLNDSDETSLTRKVGQ